jgi:hypothetical protein
VLDALGEISGKIQQILWDSSKALNEAPKALPLLIDNSGQKLLENLPSGKKLRRYAPEILAGIITGSFFNSNSALAKPANFS